MKKITLGLLVGLAALLVASCSTVSPVAGASGVLGSKTGEASQAFFAGCPLKGQGGIAQAAKNGGITIDYPASPIIPYRIVTTVVTGE